MAGRFARLIRETLARPRARVRHAKPRAGDYARRIFRDGGQTMGEYALILALVAAVAVGAFAALGPVLAAQIEAVAGAF